MKIAIIDDRLEDRELIRDYLERYMKEENFAYEISFFESGDFFLDRFEDKEYALIFLDIFMKEERDGFQTAEEIRKKDPEVGIIFSTTSPDFAINGYLVKAAGYLLKPYSYEWFAKTVDNVFRDIQSERRYIEVKEKKMLVRIPLNKIIYCDYSNHYIRIHTADRIIRSYMPFCELEEMLLCYNQFLCCYRNIIINMNEVQKMEAQNFIMSSGEQIPMRRQDKKELRQRYADYVFDRMNGGR